MLCNIEILGGNELHLKRCLDLYCQGIFGSGLPRKIFLNKNGMEVPPMNFIKFVIVRGLYEKMR
jgi:hypothetical protein